MTDLIPARPTPADAPLPEDLLWAAGGHASDIVLTCLADGETGLVPAPVRQHVASCPTCTAHLGHAALLALYTHRQLAVRREHDLVLARRPLPKVAIGLGLVVAMLGLVPSLLDPDLEAGAAHAFFGRDVPLFLRGIGALVRDLDDPGGATGLVVTYATAGLLVLVAIAVVRLLPQKEVSR